MNELIMYLYFNFIWLIWYKIIEYGVLFWCCVYFLFFCVDIVYYLIKLVYIYFINNLMFLNLLFLLKDKIGMIIV